MYVVVRASSSSERPPRPPLRLFVANSCVSPPLNRLLATSRRALHELPTEAPFYFQSYPCSTNSRVHENYPETKTTQRRGGGVRIDTSHHSTAGTNTSKTSTDISAPPSPSNAQNSKHSTKPNEPHQEQQHRHHTTQQQLQNNNGRNHEQQRREQQGHTSVKSSQIVREVRVSPSSQCCALCHRNSSCCCREKGSSVLWGGGGVFGTQLVLALSHWTIRKASPQCPEYAQFVYSPTRHPLLATSERRRKFFRWGQGERGGCFFA